jgi:hypothetical protein
MADDFGVLERMKYSGRGITLGMTSEGFGFIGYTLTGRSPPSQARRLEPGEKTGVIRTEVVKEDDVLKKMFDITDDAELVKLKEKIQKGSPALIYYPALWPVENGLIASNGAQTKLIYNEGRKRRWDSNRPGMILDEAMRLPFDEYDPFEDRHIDITRYEPDDPNFTPRVSGLLLRNNGAMHIVRKQGAGKTTEMHPLSLESGKANFIATYKGGNEDPLLSFEGGPLEMRIRSTTAEQICRGLYEVSRGHVDGKNLQVAAAVMVLRDGAYETHIINRADEVMGS